MVVDGRWEFVGSDSRVAESTIRSAARQPKVGIRIGEGNGSSIVEVDPLRGEKTRKANVYVAHAADAGVQDVLRGENKGRRLRHVAIVKDLTQVGTVDDRSGFRTEVRLDSGTRLIVFVQEPGNGPILGAALTPARGAAGR